MIIAGTAAVKASQVKKKFILTLKMWATSFSQF